MSDFRASLSGTSPAQGLEPPLSALWWAAKGDWEKAHTIVMKEESAEAAWVHAYLHRVEGDLSNAGHWYRRAHKPEARTPLPEEWQQIVEALL